MCVTRRSPTPFTSCATSAAQGAILYRATAPARLTHAGRLCRERNIIRGGGAARGGRPKWGFRGCAVVRPLRARRPLWDEAHSGGVGDVTGGLARVTGGGPGARCRRRSPKECEDSLAHKLALQRARRRPTARGGGSGGYIFLATERSR
eukprot:scaffold101376_cov28-Tisochrysis_lutea.AAC.4